VSSLFPNIRDAVQVSRGVNGVYILIKGGSSVHSHYPERSVLTYTTAVQNAIRRRRKRAGHTCYDWQLI